jgi:hypothetical protein
LSRIMKDYGRKCRAEFAIDHVTCRFTMSLSTVHSTTERLAYIMRCSIPTYVEK